MEQLKGVCIGGGYFSHFQYDAWKRIEQVRISAFAELNCENARVIAEKFSIPKHYTGYLDMLNTEKPDFVDVITPPATHKELCFAIADLKIPCICQKPFARSHQEAREIVHRFEQNGTPLMIHENFRFQPWHRKIKQLIESESIGKTLHSINFRTRTGDGHGDDAYLARQPYFRQYPRLLVYETGIHFIDTFQFLFGEIKSVSAWLRKLNPCIKGEDCALVVFEFSNGSIGQWDANRYNESTSEDPRYTFGECLIEGNEGSIRLYTDGKITLQPLGKPEKEIHYTHEKKGFAGDCCLTTQTHFINALIHGTPFETSGAEYLKTMEVMEAVYKSSIDGIKAAVSTVFHNSEHAPASNAMSDFRPSLSNRPDLTSSSN